MIHRVVATIIAIVLVVVTAIVITNDYWMHWWSEANLQAIWAEHPAWRYMFASGVVVALGYCLWVLIASIDGRLPLSSKTQHLRVIK